MRSDIIGSLMERVGWEEGRRLVMTYFIGSYAESKQGQV